MTDTAALPTPAPAFGPGNARNFEIYLGGAMSGKRPKVPLLFRGLEDGARAVMSPEGFDYVAGGAGTEDTMAENRRAFDRWRIVPRHLRGVTHRDLSITLFGRKLASPLLLAPIGVQELAHAEGDLASARAAAAEKVPFVMSNQASFPMEEIAGAMGTGSRWFQLYWSISDELTASLVARAEACGSEAIVVTLDTTQLGWRPRDLSNAYMPFIHGKGIAQYTSDPVFQGMLGAASSSNTMAAGAKFVEVYSNPGLSWAHLAFLRGRTKLPILLKGVLAPGDAKLALDHGMSGIIVSNHGGRQVDGEIAALDALPEVAAAVNGAIPVLFDSGIRSGADVFKALALGATGVMLGRPYVYGLAISGMDGVREVIRNTLADFDLTMGLAGCRSTGEIGAAAVRRVPAA